jgi:hypothetical protein
MPILPSFDQFPEEGAIIGKLVVGFGEIELLLGTIAAGVTQDLDTMLRALYSNRTTGARITLAAEFSKPGMKKHNLEVEFATALNIVKQCHSLRNQYAHCHWAHDAKAGLFFTDLEQAASRATGFNWDWKHVDKPLLTLQERYFDYCKDFLLFIDLEHLLRSGVRRGPSFSMPQEQALPIPHNLASQHVPPWLSEDNKRRHLERALEAERSAPQPKRPPSILKLTEEEWHAKAAKDAREGRPPTGS